MFPCMHSQRTDSWPWASGFLSLCLSLCPQVKQASDAYLLEQQHKLEGGEEKPAGLLHGRLNWPRRLHELKTTMRCRVFTPTLQSWPPRVNHSSSPPPPRPPPPPELLHKAPAEQRADLNPWYLQVRPERATAGVRFVSVCVPSPR